MSHYEERVLVAALWRLVLPGLAKARRVAGDGGVLIINPPRRSGLPALASVVVLAAFGAALRWAPGPEATPPGAGPTTLSGLAAPRPPQGLPVVRRPAPEPAINVVRTTIGRGGTLTSALERLAVPSVSRDLVAQTVGSHIDLRRLQPDASVAAVLGADGTQYSVTVRNEPESFLRVAVRGTAAPFDIRSEVVNLPVNAKVERAGGEVRTSVAQALSGSPNGVLLTAAFADVFQWDVDLLVDPRPGDRVRIVYEAHRLARPPADMPALAGAPNAEGDLVRIGKILAASYEGAMARSTGFWIADDRGGGNYFDADGQPLRKAFLKSPLNYRRISSGFSRARMHPVLRKVVPHHGVDFAAAPGTPVVATADGKVVGAGWDGPLGRAVRIRHGSQYVTVYGHLRGFAPGIRSGVDVKQNQVIGYVGSTGRATGPHLHYTMIEAGRPINPMTFQSPAAEPLQASQLRRLGEAKQRWLPLLHAPNIDRADSLAIAAGTADRRVRTGS